MGKMLTRNYRPGSARLHLYLRGRTGGPKLLWAWPVYLLRCRRRPRSSALLAFRCPQYREAFAHG